MHGRLAAGLAIAVVIAAPAGAAVPSGNLLVNPGAEAGPGAPDDSQAVAPPGWNVESTFTAVQYGASGGFPTAADGAALGGGANFFAGGPGGATSAATQVVDVSAAASEIDAGKVGATLGAALGGYASQTDHGTVPRPSSMPRARRAGRWRCRR